jgi:nitrate reductase beta subunit
MCVSGCPYKKIYYNWESGKAEKCILCYPRIESGMPTACAESCVGRIRYMGVVLYDADEIESMASVKSDRELYAAQKKLFLDPNDPAVVTKALEQGVPQNWINAAQASPVYKMAIEWGIAFPLHPEYRTLPMMWYVPPLSPVQSQIDQGNLPTEADGVIPKVETLRTPARFLANMFTAGDEQPILDAIRRLLAMRSFQRGKRVTKQDHSAVLAQVGLTPEQADEMYRYLGIGNYEDRFVLPTSNDELRQEDYYAVQGNMGFSPGNTSADGRSDFSLFPRRRTDSVVPIDVVPPPRKKESV